MNHEKRIEKSIRPAARKCAKMIRAKFPNMTRSKTILEKRLIEIEEAKRDNCSQDYINYLTAKLPI